MEYNTVVFIEFGIKPGTIPVIKKEILKNDSRFKFTIRINKLSFEYPLEKISNNLHYRSDSS